MKPMDTGTEEDDLRTLARLVMESTEEAQALTKAIQTTCDTLLRRLDEPVVPGLQGSIDEILQVVRAEKQPPKLAVKRLVGLGVGLVLLSGGLGWYLGQVPGVTRQKAVLMEQVNGALLERYQGLPADLKAKLATVYKRQGFPPLEQQGGSKP